MTRPADWLSDEDEVRKAQGLTPPVPVEEHRRRVLRTQAAMERHGFDALFVYGTASPQPDWVRYLVNFVHPYLFTGSFVVLSRQGEPILLIDREWNLPNAREMTWVEDVRWYPYGAFRWQFDEVARACARGPGSASWSWRCPRCTGGPSSRPCPRRSWPSAGTSGGTWCGPPRPTTGGGGGARRPWRTPGSAAA